MIDMENVWEARLLIQMAEMLEMDVPDDLLETAFAVDWERPSGKPIYWNRLYTPACC